MNPQIQLFLLLMEFKTLQYDQLDSTNAEAARLWQTGNARPGMVIVANEQTGGKGHGNNQWESEPGKNLTFSILYKPETIMPQEQFRLTQLISISLWEVLNSILRKKIVTIKWPNDLYVGDKKIAGILIQNFIKGNTIDLSIIGIGLNVSQKEFLSDAPNPTSIVLESGIDCPMDNLLDDILETFSQNTSKYNSKQAFKDLTNIYLDKLYRFNKDARFSDLSGNFTGKITGISDYGHLLIKDETGNIREYSFKEVRFI